MIADLPNSTTILGWPQDWALISNKPIGRIPVTAIRDDGRTRVSAGRPVGEKEILYLLNFTDNRLHQQQICDAEIDSLYHQKRHNNSRTKSKPCSINNSVGNRGWAVNCGKRREAKSSQRETHTCSNKPGITVKKQNWQIAIGFQGLLSRIAGILLGETLAINPNPSSILHHPMAESVEKRKPYRCPNVLLDIPMRQMRMQ